MLFSTYPNLTKKGQTSQDVVYNYIRTPYYLYIGTPALHDTNQQVACGVSSLQSCVLSQFWCSLSQMRLAYRSFQALLTGAQAMSIIYYYNLSRVGNDLRAGHL